MSNRTCKEMKLRQNCFKTVSKLFWNCFVSAKTKRSDRHSPRQPERVTVEAFCFGWNSFIFRCAESLTHLERIRSWLPDRFWVPWDKVACFRTRRLERVSRRLSCRSSGGRRPVERRWSSRCSRGRSQHIDQSSVVRTAPSSLWSLRPRNTRRETPPCRNSRHRMYLSQMYE